MKYLLEEIEQAAFDVKGLNRLAPEVHKLQSGSFLRSLFEQAGRIARTLEKDSSFLTRKDGEEEMQKYWTLLEQARNSLKF